MRIACDSTGNPRVLLPLVKSQLGLTPDIWMVYLAGIGATPAADVAWLHSQGLGVGAVYAGVWGTSGLAGGYIRGQDDAALAIARAQAIGLGPQTRLWLDIEPNWCANADRLAGAGTAASYMRGWADGFNGAAYLTGIYCDTHDAVFVETFRASGLTALPLWSCEPQVTDFNQALRGWNAGSVPPATTVMWQAQINVPVGNGQVDLSVVADNCDGFWGVSTVPFVDVPANSWYAKDVETAVAAGLLKGETPTHFFPNAPVTRAQLAAVCARLVEILKLPTTTVGEEAPS